MLDLGRYRSIGMTDTLGFFLFCNRNDSLDPFVVSSLELYSIVRITTVFDFENFINRNLHIVSLFLHQYPFELSKPNRLPFARSVRNNPFQVKYPCSLCNPQPPPVVSCGLLPNNINGAHLRRGRLIKHATNSWRTRKPELIFMRLCC